VKQIRFLGPRQPRCGAPQLGITRFPPRKSRFNAIHCQRETSLTRNHPHPPDHHQRAAMRSVSSPRRDAGDLRARRQPRGGSPTPTEGRPACLRAGAMAMGARSRSRPSPAICAAQRPRHGHALRPPCPSTSSVPANSTLGGHRTGFDPTWGDIAHLMPVIHPYVASARGKNPRRRLHIHEPQHAS